MDGFLLAFCVSFGLIFVAELGDKSQLLALTLATRHRALPVLAGITIATGAVHGLSVVVGHGFGAVLPTGWISLAGALAFVAFGAWTLRGEPAGGAEGVRGGAGGPVVLSTAVAFFVAELGDKTMLATIAVATRYGWFGTWLGSTLGMVAADALAILVGRTLGRHLPERVIAVGAALTFFGFGGWLATDALARLSGRPAWTAVSAAVDHHVAGWLAFVLVVVVAVLAMGRPGRATRTPSRRRAWSRPLAVAAVAAGLVVAVLVGLDVLQPVARFDHTALFLAGAALAVVGAGLLVLAARTRAREVAVRDTAVVVATAGLLLMVPTPAALLAFGLGVAAVRTRARTPATA